MFELIVRSKGKCRDEDFIDQNTLELKISTNSWNSCVTMLFDAPSRDNAIQFVRKDAESEIRNLGEGQETSVELVEIDALGKRTVIRKWPEQERKSAEASCCLVATSPCCGSNVEKPINDQ